MTEPGQKDPFSPQMRMVVAWVLCIVVFFVWIKYFAPKPPAQPPKSSRPAQSAPVAPGPAASSAGNAAQASAAAAGIAPAARPAVPAKSDSQEHTIVVENGLYRVEISNRGAVVKSWQLKKYQDDAKPQRVLDVVHQDASQQTGGWPFALVLDDEQLGNAANSGLYQSSTGNTLRAPAEAEFEWSDGHLEITKHFKFDHTYVVRVEASAKFDGKPIAAGFAWLGGFGDLTVSNPAPVETVTTYYSEGGKITTYPYKNLETLDKLNPTVWQGGKDFVGIEDRYFTAAFLPVNGSAPGTLQTRYWKAFRTVQANGQETQEPVSEVAATASSQPLALRVYVGPKDYDDLKKMNPPLHGLINFGWLEFISDPLFHALKWLHGYIPNWGWAIVVLTFVISILFLPLRISSYKTTIKMQKVAPEIKAIQEKYKKYKFNDPRKQEMQKETMAIYQREGINPVGGCLPMLLQMPLWIGLNRSLSYAIEMRHARWLWIADLASKDPYYVLPVLMGLSMYLGSKMTPMTATDPQQQAMMKVMPVAMAGLFMVMPISSGLAVYILTSGVVQILQQWYLNRAHPLPVATKVAKGRKSQ